MSRERPSATLHLHKRQAAKAGRRHIQLKGKSFSLVKIANKHRHAPPRAFYHNYHRKPVVW
jgi:hypothetical protein